MLCLMICLNAMVGRKLQHKKKDGLKHDGKKWEERRGGRSYICPALDFRLVGRTFFVSEDICFGSEENLALVEREHSQRK
jgi:hypothetical protein